MVGPEGYDVSHYERHSEFSDWMFVCLFVCLCVSVCIHIHILIHTNTYIGGNFFFDTNMIVFVN